MARNRWHFLYKPFDNFEKPTPLFTATGLRNILLGSKITRFYIHFALFIMRREMLFSQELKPTVNSAFSLTLLAKLQTLDI